MATGVTHWGPGVIQNDDHPAGLGFYNGVFVEIDNSETDELKDILHEQLPDFLKLFIQKNKEYGENAQTLGPRGQFADIWRKIAKLKTGLWDGEEDKLTSEGVDEILRDLIGHCFLILSMRSRERAEAQEGSDIYKEMRKANLEKNAIQSELRTIVRRLPDLSLDSISKIDVVNAENLPIAKELLYQESERARAALVEAEGRNKDDDDFGRGDE